MRCGHGSSRGWRRGRRIVTEETRAEMRRILAEVREGKLTEALIADARAGYPRLEASRAEAAAHPIEAVRKRLAALAEAKPTPRT